MMDKIVERLERAIQERVFPGCVLGIVGRSGEKRMYPVGKLTYESSSPDVREDTIYDVASVTKSIPGSTSLLKLVDDGDLNLDDKLADFVPGFGNFEDKKTVTIKHILTYTLDLDVPSTSSLKHKTPDQILDVLTKAPLKSKPGTRYIYTNSTAAFVGLIIEKVTGKSLDIFADECFFKPLGMNRTTFYPKRFNRNEIAPTEIDDTWRKRVIQGEVHDESTSVLQQKYIPGIAGLFSTVPNLLLFQEMLLNDGVKDGKRYFSKDIIREMHTNQLSILSESAGLGWEMGWPGVLDGCCSDQTFFKTGFTGCLVVTDPIKGVGFTLLSNRTYPKRPKDSSAINAMRRDIAELIFRNS